MLALPFIVAAASLVTQGPPPETQQFAFWIGKWNCEGTTYSAQGNQATKATNNVTWSFDKHVVHEHFEMDKFKGESWSVYSPQLKVWRQTWVDNTGNYFALKGAFEDGKMTLVTLPNPARPGVATRMVFSNITKDAFDWNWENTTDDGKTWKLIWHLRYTRKGK